MCIYKYIYIYILYIYIYYLYIYIYTYIHTYSLGHLKQEHLKIIKETTETFKQNIFMAT